MPRQRVKEIEIINFTRQFATLYKSGYDIPSAITALREQTYNPVLLEALKNIQEDLMSGDSLSCAMAKYPKIFNSFYLDFIKAGEASGHLDRVMTGMADLLDKERPLKRDFQLALFLPLIPCGVFLIVPIMAVIFNPQFSQMPLDYKILYPLIFFLSLIRHFWFILLLGILFYIFIRTEKGRFWWDKAKLKIPAVGSVIHKMKAFRFAHTFEILYKANSPLLDNLALIIRNIGNSYISCNIESIRNTVLMGGGLAPAVRAFDTFPAVVGEMIANGEEGGRLNEILPHLTFYLYSELEKEVRNFGRLMHLITIIIFIIGTILTVLRIF